METFNIHIDKCVTVNTSKTLDQTKETDKIDFQSFIQGPEECTEESCGMSQIVEVKEVDSDKGQEIIDKVDLNNVSQIFRIEKLLDSKEQYVVVDDKDMRFIKRWTNRNKISRLAGQFIPVEEINDNIYRVHKFEQLTEKLEIEDVKYLYQNNCIKYDDGEWSPTIKWKNYNRFISGIQSISSFLGIVFATAGVIFLTVQNSSIVYLYMIGLWMITLGIQMHLSKRREKPLKFILENF